MSKYLRTFLYDSTYECKEKLAKSIINSWEQSIAVSLIPLTFPKNVIDELIIKIDPNEVIDLTDDNKHIRDLAIVENTDLATVVFTSGTVSNPKPVELSFEAMKNSVEALYKYCSLSSSDTWLCCLPLHYIAGLSILARCFISKSQFIIHESFDIEKFKFEINNRSFDAVSLMPSQLREILKSDIDISHLKAVLVGGTNIDQELVNTCLQKNIKLLWTYGMTETFGGICINGDFLEGNIGRINNSILEIRSKSIMSAYRHDYKLTQQCFTSDGYFITKDRAEIVNGKLNILGRTDDIIISGGIKIDLAKTELLFKPALQNINFVLFPSSHNDLGHCLGIGIRQSQIADWNITEIRNKLRDLVPSTHLPIRLYRVNDEQFDSGLKLSRFKISNSATLVDEYEI